MRLDPGRCPSEYPHLRSYSRTSALCGAPVDERHRGGGSNRAICAYLNVIEEYRIQRLEPDIRSWPGFSRMEIAFASKALRELCNNEIRAVEDLGSALALLLHRRLADLDAADRADELFFLDQFFTTTVVDGNDIILVRLDDANVMYCEPYMQGTRAIRTEAGETDWNKVSRIKILELRSQDETRV